MAVRPPPKTFFVASFGRSGTVWLAKALNAHPDVLAFHEGVMQQIFPRPWHTAGVAETANWFKTLLAMGHTQVGWHAYAALGDLNSFGGFHRTEPWSNEIFTWRSRLALLDVVGDRGFLLLRQPLAALESKRVMLEPLLSLYTPVAGTYVQKLVQLNPLLQAVARSMSSPQDAVFLMLCLHLRWVLKLPLPAVQLERVSRSPQELVAFAQQLTGVTYSEEILAARMSVKENESASGAAVVRDPESIWNRWPAAWREAYAVTCGGLSQIHGYSEPNCVPSLESLAGIDHPGTLAALEPV